MYSTLIVLIQGQGTEGAAQGIVSPPSGGISPLAWVIICALSAALVAVSKFFVTVYNDLKKAREELATAYEDQAQLLKALRTGLDMPKPSTHFPPPNPPPGGQGGV
jgi:hypothetical protein